MIELINSVLKEVIDTIEGIIPLTPEIEDIMNKIYDNIVPRVWKKACYPSTKPLASWSIDLNRRIDFLTKWIENGIPTKFWIGAFY